MLLCDDRIPEAETSLATVEEKKGNWPGFLKLLDHSVNSGPASLCMSEVNNAFHVI